MGKALIVDDDQNSRLLLATFVQHAGHTALEAESGAAALRIAADELPDLVIVDLSLPDMNGAELIRRLRKDAKMAKVPIALYTATTMAPAIEQLVDIYAISAVIPKPGDPKEVLETIRLLLTRQSA